MEGLLLINRIAVSNVNRIFIHLESKVIVKYFIKLFNVKNIMVFNV
jgi:hypothetical protein